MTPRRSSVVAAASAALTLLILPGAARADGEGPQITIYNQDFALVRMVRSLRLKEGESEVRVGGVAGMLEPDSVVLRDLKDPKGIRILEQNYEGDPLSPGFMLRRNEGRVGAFQSVNPASGKKEIVSGRVIRSGYTGPQVESPAGRLPPSLEGDGKLQVALRGEPLFQRRGGV